MYTIRIEILGIVHEVVAADYYTASLVWQALRAAHPMNNLTVWHGAQDVTERM